MRAICIARHRFLSDHLCTVFHDIGLECVPIVGFVEGMAAAREQWPDVVICDYDLLIAASLSEWENDRALAAVPIVAVSLTRRPDEVQVLDAERLAGFLYLPGLPTAAVAAAVHAATGRAVRAPAFSLSWMRPDGMRARPQP